MAFDWATLGMSGLLDPIDNKNVPQALRQKIALAMLMQKRAYPKTFGEGLASIGDSLGDAFAARGVYRDAAEAEKVGSEAFKSVSGSSPIVAPPPVTTAPRRTSAVSEPDDTEVASTAAASTQPGLLPAKPMTEEEQAIPANAPPGTVRMPPPERVQDWRNSVPRPNIPPVPQTVVQTDPAPRALVPQPQSVPPTPASTPFADRFRGAQATPPQSPPPGTSVMAAGDEPSAEERNTGRNMLTQAIMAQRGAQGAPQPQAASQPPVTPPPPQPAPQAAITPMPQPPAVRPVPPSPQVGPPVQTFGAGYVPQMKAEPPMPPTMTQKMQDILQKVQDTPPAYRENVQRALQPLYQQEQDKLKTLHENWGNTVKDVRAHNLKVEELRGSQQGRIDTSRKTGAELPSQTAPPAADDPRLLGTDQSPQRAGPRIGPVPPGDIPERWTKQEATRIEKEKNSYESTKPELTDTLNIIDKIRAHPAKPYATGMLSGVTALTPAGKGFVALNEQLTGKNLVDAYQKLQGTGQIGEKEGQNFAKARARLTTAATEADYDAALQDLESTVRGTLERAQRRLNMPVTAYQRTNEDPYAPDIGQIDDTWKDGRVRQYIGGDPHDKVRSWKIVR